MKKLKVSDITLVVAQEERKSISFREKLQIAASLAKMGVDGIELPAACENKETAVVYRTLAESVPVAVCMPVGDSEASLNFAYSCIKGAKKARSSSGVARFSGANGIRISPKSCKDAGKNRYSYGGSKGAVFFGRIYRQGCHACRGRLCGGGLQNCGGKRCNLRLPLRR
jgi:hypothetical protein